MSNTWYEKNKEHVSQRQKARYQLPEVKAQRAEYRKKYAKENKDKINEYQREYSRKNPDKKLWSAINTKTTRRRHFEEHISKNDFSKWYEAQNKECDYCGLPQELVDKDPRMKRRYSLTLDRKDNDRGYWADNIVLACFICNLVKCHVLTYEEMKEVGERFIRPKWQKLHGIK